MVSVSSYPPSILSIETVADSDSDFPSLSLPTWSTSVDWLLFSMLLGDCNPPVFAQSYGTTL